MMELSSIGRYQLLRVIGKGGMGLVYLARDPILQRLVAIKVLSPHLSSDETVIARFINEARIAASLQHPNIVTVYEAGQDGNFVFMAMEYVEGQDLASLIRQKGKLHPDEAIAILKAVASALDYAHQKGVIHRDVKPSNVLISNDGVVKLMDFGIARVVGGERHTKTGVLVGTPEYMAPELWEGKDADKMADLYSLGVMAYEMLTGEVPFTGDTPIAIGYKHVHSEIPRSGLGGMVDEVLKVAMAKEKEKRFQSGMAMVMALEQALMERGEGRERESIAVTEAEKFKVLEEQVAMQPTSLKPVSMQLTITQPRGRRKVATWVLATTIIVLSLVGISWKPIQEAREKARQAECLSNLRYLGMGVMQYCVDYDERMPLAYNWADAISPYIRNRRLYQCPSREGLEIGYAYNRYLNGISMEKISRVIETVCLFESNLGGSNPSDYGESWIEGGVHSGGNFVSFVDGHVKWYSWTQKQFLQISPILSQSSNLPTFSHKYEHEHDLPSISVSEESEHEFHRMMYGEPDGNWFVIGGTYLKSEKSKAEAKAQKLREAGFWGAQVLDSSQFPRLRPNFWIVVVVRFKNRDDAIKVMNELKSKGFDAYIRLAF
ncbi:MAG: hypothetical protein DFNUSKGM_000353 [Candidatus Fervidibacter sacchari]